MSRKPFDAGKLYVIIGLLFIALTGIRTISTPEIWSHLAQGKGMTPISFLEPENAVNTTLLYDKVVYALWNVGGATALILFNVACLLAAFWLLLQVSKKWGGPLSQGFALLVCGHLIFPGLDVGPQTVQMLFIALFVYILSTVKSPGVLFGTLIPLQILWTNTHGSFLFGPVITAAAAVQAMQTGRSVVKRRQQSVLPARLWMLTGALLLATLVNPYFFRLHRQVLASVLHPFPAYWISLLNGYFRIPQNHPLVFFVLVLGAGGLITLKKRLPVMLTTLAIIGAILVVRSSYAMQLFVALAFPFIVLSFSAVGEYLTGSFRSLVKGREHLLEKIGGATLIILFILSAVPIATGCVYTRLGSASRFGFGIEEELFPSGAAATLLEDERFPKRILNFAADGGYLAYRYGRQAFIDFRPGRYEKSMLKDFAQMLTGDKAAYDKIYDKYRPEAIIINTLMPGGATGAAALLQRDIWKLAYFDGTTAILLVNKEKFAPLLNNKEVQQAGLQQIETARRRYEEAVKAGKTCRVGNPVELIGAGKVFLAFNRPKEAEAIFSLLVKGNNRVGSAWLGLGDSQLMLLKYDEAMKSLRKATELMPKSLMAWAHYAQACRFVGEEEEFQRALRQVKTLSAHKKKMQEKLEPKPETPAATKESGTNAPSLAPPGLDPAKLPLK